MDTNKSPEQSASLGQQVEQAAQLLAALKGEINKALVGQEAAIEQVLKTLLAAGHVLIEGVPGLGKTLLVRALARCFQGGYARVQFTPDLMPSDITGYAVYDKQTEQFQFRRGPVFTHLLLADEINRAPAKTQAALLEVMQEKQVTVDGQALPVGQPFMVLATQNPIEQEGTYPLPEAELDRFLMKVDMDFPDPQEEVQLVQRVTQGSLSDQLAVDNLQPLLSAEKVLQLQALTAQLVTDPVVVDYAVRLVRATRDWPGISQGAGPRASLGLIRLARANALLAGRDHVLPEDVRANALAVLRHRLILAAEMQFDNLDPDQLLRQLVDQVEAPRQ